VTSGIGAYFALAAVLPRTSLRSSAGRRLIAIW
jgi:hypothetical protein